MGTTTSIKKGEIVDWEIKNKSSMIILIDQISIKRNPYSGVENKRELNKTRKLPKQSMENNLDYGILLAGEQNDLTKIMLQLDQTINKRN